MLPKDKNNRRFFDSLRSLRMTASWGSEHSLRALLPLCLVVQTVQLGQGFVGHVPLAKDLVDDAGGEAGRDQPAHHARGLFFVFRLADALALQVLAGEGFLIGLGVAGFEGLIDEFRAYALLLQVLANAALAQLLVFMAQAGIGFAKAASFR